MRVLVQRVNSAKVTVENGPPKAIQKGLVVFLGIGEMDTDKDAEFLSEKVMNLRIFANNEGKFDRSLIDVKGEALIVSQFTLYGDCSKGRRPDFTAAARPDKAIPLYEQFIENFRKNSIPIETGEFGKHMVVEILNDGPVTIFIDSESK